jgi:hypothetical protein
VRPGHEIYICEPDPAEPGVIRDLREAELQAVARRATSRTTREMQ